MIDSQRRSFGARGHRYLAEGLERRCASEERLATWNGRTPAVDPGSREAYARNAQPARTKLIETYLSPGASPDHEGGLLSLEDRSRPPHRSPGQTPKVIEAEEKTGDGRKRLAWYMGRENDLALSAHTIHPILYWNGFRGRKKRRNTFYPAHWAWEEERPFPWLRGMGRMGATRGRWGGSSLESGLHRQAVLLAPSPITMRRRA